ncbi:MAG: fructose-bisphosphate aldolase class I [Dehalococcoidales bacterium]|nr:fructose-bisphosphate aldolase class I [Dehalococcoidales bacterium]
MNTKYLSATAKALVAGKKGILAADESTGTIARRFDAVKVECTEENRRDYREMLFRTSDVSEFLSGIILYDETIRQKASDRTPFVSILQNKGIIPGIKVDKGAKHLAGAEKELVTEGLDGLRERFEEYFRIGARFAKWRAVLLIGDKIPSDYCIEVNAHAMARYAMLAQEAGLVPIVEPEVLMDGGHSIDDCFAATERMQHELFHQLSRQGVALEGCILKSNMILSGKDATNRASPEEVAEKTVSCLMRTVPAAVPGVVFLSGGQGDEESVLNLNAISLAGEEAGAPWELSFSYSRGLQLTPLKIWSGIAANIQEAQKAFYQRCLVTSQARCGSIVPVK